MQFLASISLLLFDVLIVLNLPIVSNHTLGYTMLIIRFFKIHYVENLIVTEKNTKSITCFEYFFKHDVCAIIYIVWQCFYSNWFCHFY